MEDQNPAGSSTAPTELQNLCSLKPEPLQLEARTSEAAAETRSSPGWFLQTRFWIKQNSFISDKNKKETRFSCFLKV
ncbi:hypothetical protein ILYODFUR_037807 [Ilyodon furcidens]|uniref:Uncharacterized protein n=1 Tax=Ilyodon furcidens TaxID=33524 RepID=A0ABV0VKE6_9TELE